MTKPRDEPVIVAGPERRQRVIEICRALPEVMLEEQQHVTFRVRGKTFAYYLDDHHGDGRVALNCKAAPNENHELVASDSIRFFIPAYLGPHGWGYTSIFRRWTGSR